MALMWKKSLQFVCFDEFVEKAKAQCLSRVVADPFRKGVEQGPQWMIEQATFSDLGLHLQWLKFFTAKVAQYCSFFKSFVIMVDDAKDHPVIKCLESVWEELKSIFSGKLNPQLLPCFSTKLMRLTSLE